MMTYFRCTKCGRSSLSEDEARAHNCDPTPSKDEEIRRLTSERDELVSIAMMARGFVQVQIDECKELGRSEEARECIAALAKIDELLNRIEPKFPDVGQMEGP